MTRPIEAQAHDVVIRGSRLRILCGAEDVGPCEDESVDCPRCGTLLDVTVDIIVEEVDEDEEEEDEE